MSADELVVRGGVWVRDKYNHVFGKELFIKVDFRDVWWGWRQLLKWENILGAKQKNVKDEESTCMPNVIDRSKTGTIKNWLTDFTVLFKSSFGRFLGRKNWLVFVQKRI